MTTETTTIDNTTGAVVTITPNQVAADLIEAGQQIATGHSTVGSSERRYAALMSAAFPGWHLLTEKDDSNEAKLIKAGPKAKLFEQLKAAKHTNPSTVWSRLRKYAAAATVAAEGGESSQDAGKRTIEVRLIEELLKLTKAIDKEDHPSEKVRNARVLIGLALVKMGVSAETTETQQAA